MSKSPQPPPSRTTAADAKPSAKRPSKAARRENADGSRWLWPFQLTERLGEGGMGVVYRARYVVNDREVAVKMVPDDVQDPVILARFEQEMEILKDLKHPNIVRCFGGACENENRFYAMELVEGGSLEDDIKLRGKLPWEQVVEYGEQMVAALQASHEKGIVHRDIKPGNFLKTKTGTLKLSDFGLARIDAGRRITRAGKTAGTVLYMAPEQIRGQDITVSADLYALGCVFYEMLTGRTPFTGDSAAAVLHAHISEIPPRLGQKATDCPPALEDLVHQLMEKEVQNRPASAAEVGTRLASLADTIHLSHRAAGGVLSSRPTSVPSSQTVPMEAKTVFAREVFTEGKKELPVWSIVAMAGSAIVLMAALYWQASTASSLRPWKAQWIEVASEPGPNQRFALLSLVEVAPDDPVVVDVIVQALQSSNAKTREAAAEAAHKVDSGDMRLVGALNRLAQNDDSSGVRYHATRAAQAIQRR